MTSSRRNKVLDYVESFLAQNAEPSQNGIYEYEQDGDYTSLQFIDVGEEINEFPVNSIAEVKTIFNPKGIPGIKHQHLGWVNTRTVYGCFQIEEGSLCLRARITIYDDEPAFKLIGDLILRIYGGQQAFGVYQLRADVSEKALLEYRAVLANPRSWPDRVSLEEFERSAKWFTEHGYLSSEGENGFLLEVPLSGDVPSRLVEPDAETALLHVYTNFAHPLMGAGYLATIALPVNPLPNWINQVADKLNSLEFEEKDFVPQIGAWGVRGLGKELVYSQFIPSTGRIGDLHNTLMNWSIIRTIWLRDHFWAPGIGVSFARDGEEHE